MKVRAWRGFHWFCSWQNLDDDEKVKRADAALTDVLRRLGLLTNDRWRELSDARRALIGTPAATIDDAVNAAAASVLETRRRYGGEGWQPGPVI